MALIILSIIFQLIASSGGAYVSDKEYAKLPPVFEVDNFDRCLLFEDEALYCFVEYHVKPINPHNTTVTWKNIQALSKNPRNYRHDHLRHGICIPLTCPNISKSHEGPDFRKDLANCYNNKYENLGIKGTIEHAYCQTKEPPKFDILDTAVAFFLIAYTLFVVYATFYEGLARYKTPDEYKEITSTQYGQVISCFSIFRNWERLKTIDWTPENVRFRGLQGIRFYNMYLVILVHASMVYMCGPIANTKFAESIHEDPTAIVLASGNYGLTTFLQISSLLLTYSIVKLYNEKSEKELTLKTAIWIFIYRYIRLTPALAVTVLLHSTLLVHSGRGPWWDEFMGIDRINCRENGWANLLYLNNWIEPNRMCLLETWYLAVDTQNFVIVLALLYFTVKSPRRFWLFLIIGWIVNHILVIWHIFDKELFHFMRNYPENLYKFQAFFKEDGIWVDTQIYTPMTFGSTILGSALGYWLYKNEKTEIITSKTRLVLWHIGTYGIGLGIVLIPGIWLFSKNYYDSYWFSVPYLTFGPTIYCLAVSLGLIGVIQGGAWVTKWILEWPPLYYLGRISYTAYLAHNMVVYYILASQKSLPTFNYLNVSFLSIEILALSLISGLILSLLVEYPISALSSMFLKKKITKETNRNDVKQKIS